MSTPTVSPLQIQQINRTASKVLDQRGRQAKNGGNATDPQDFVTLAQLNAGLASLNINQGSGLSVINGVTVITYNLVAATLINFTVRNTLLVVYLVQDATGGRVVTWGTAFAGIPGQGLDTPNSKSVYTFCPIQGKWVLISSSVNL